MNNATKKRRVAYIHNSPDFTDKLNEILQRTRFWNMCSKTWIKLCKYRVSQEFKSIFWDLIPELLLSQKRHSYTCGSNSQRFRSKEFWSTVNKLGKRSIMHLLRYAVECTVTDSPFNTQASCSKCPPSAKINFLTHVTRELVTLWSTAALLMLLAALRTCWSSSLVFTLCGPHRWTKCYQSYGG
jgi:hypothetical protein